MKLITTTKPTSLRKEIMLTLILKFMAMGVIWALCFSQPIKHQLDTLAISQHLFA